MPDRTILIVDDDDSLRFLLANEIRPHGFDVSGAGDGDEAIELVREKAKSGGKFTAILLDISMPKVSGFEVLKFVKETTPETRVIMVTAYADVENAIKSMRLGASEIIAKPYDLAELFATINRALEK